ncbi:MAG: di-trans,poly-cis-decaprenylcistransferase [Clostridiales bacterium]|nr:di-trans,poly-cis-decaprenylcistransferase [Clostridiales bacterium]
MLGWRKKRAPVRLVDDKLRHIAFIMDGNGRWAQKRGMPREFGHVNGAANFKRIVRYCGDIGIKIVTVYAFSTENWTRPQNEVNAIMKLLSEYTDMAADEMDVHNIRYRFIGDRSVLSEELIGRINRLERDSEKNELLLNIALNYGARKELVSAFNALAMQGRANITERDISEHLYTAHCPDPDLIIRTGGEIRLSNFLLWQAAYAELYFTDVLWPDLKSSDIDEAVRVFYSRKRRYGGI